MLLGNTAKFSKVTLGLVSKVFSAVDGFFTDGKQHGVIDPQMAEADQDESIVAGGENHDKQWKSVLLEWAAAWWPWHR